MNKKLGFDLQKKLLAIVACSFCMSPAISGEITYSDDSYASGDTLTAGDLNAKFNAIKESVNGNDANITTSSSNIETNTVNITANTTDIEGNTTTIYANTNNISSITNSINTLQNRVSALENPPAPTRFVDNGDGTITDNETGLMWEMKVDSDGVQDFSNPQDADNTYSWSSTSSDYPDGAIKSDFLDRTNCYRNCGAGTLGDYTDWRIPTLSELRTIVEAGCSSAPCVIDPMFSGAKSSFYWTMSRTGDVDYAMTVQFSDGSEPSYFKPAAHYVRAVRRHQD